MRWLFLIVLSLNFTYIAWQLTQPVVQAYKDVRPLKNVSPIILLSEFKQVAVQAPSLLHDKNVGPVEMPAHVAMNDEAALLQAKAVEVLSVDNEKEAKLAAVALSKENVFAEVDPLKATDVSQLRSDSKEMCFTLGPFRDLGKLRALTKEIKPYVITTDFRGREEREQSLYWVYVRPEKNNEKAVATGKRLKAKKIKDFYVIHEGEKIHGLSLGRFRNKSGAYGLAEKVRKLGFNVIVEPVFKAYTVYWLDYQLDDGVNMPEALLKKYTQSVKKSKISRLSRRCVLKSDE